jgi:hypothetical protein
MTTISMLQLMSTRIMPIPSQAVVIHLVDLVLCADLDLMDLDQDQCADLDQDQCVVLTALDLNVDLMDPDLDQCVDLMDLDLSVDTQLNLHVEPVDNVCLLDALLKDQHLFQLKQKVLLITRNLKLL